MNKIIRLLTLFLIISGTAIGQSIVGEITGKITNEKNEPLDFASVVAMQGGIVKAGSKTDLNGNYKIKALEPGMYTLKVTYLGYPAYEIKDVQVTPNGKKVQDVKMVKAEAGKELGTVTIRSERKLVDPGTPNNKTLDKEFISKQATVNTGDIVSNLGGIYQRRQGDAGISIGGDRSSGTMYMIDGVMIRGSRNINLPPNSITSIQLMSNGLSAKYGNATGGFPVITTRGISPELGGSINFQHSVEGFNNNLLSIDLSGPLVSIKRKGKDYKEPFMGFSLNASFNYDKDNNPTWQNYRLSDERLRQLEETPLVLNPNGNGQFVKTSEMVTSADFQRIKARRFGESMNANLIGKIDFQPTSQISVRLGTITTVSRVKGTGQYYSLFAPKGGSIVNDISSRNYIFFTHRLGKSFENEKKEDKKSAISDAYYTIQFTYQKDKQTSRNPEHGLNYFDYGYLGKFNTQRFSFYTLGKDSVTGLTGQRYFNDFAYNMTYTPAGMNPLLENYTKAVYNYSEQYNNPIANNTELQALGGLRNGDGPAATYSFFASPGTQITGTGSSEIDRATLTLDASLDIEQGKRNVLGKSPITHNIEFGLGYDQANNRYYNVAASGLWSLMRLISNRHISNLDLSNPIFTVGGQQYTKDQISSIDFSVFDTIKYNRLYDANQHARFDKELRKKLYNNQYDLSLIDIDSYDPSTFSIDMFSAEDLMINGAGYVTWGGYDYLGNRLKKQPSFNDFWTKKDSRGDYLRPIGSFRPIYMYGYILDQFSYKDLAFNIGLRVDRYDANQKVLKDPYSLYGVLTAGDIKDGTYNTAKGNTAPKVSSFDKDYVVYVDNNQSSNPTVVGYRKGDTWFDPYGKEIQDPSVLSELYSGGLPIQPWLLNKTDSIKSSNFNPNNSFDDYKPQVALSPRIQFTFPISDASLLYGNYDVVTQQPSSNSWVTPDDYYYMKERQSTINNANMRMEKGINYALGFQQALSKTSVVTIEAYYRERRNQIQIQRYNLAYPITYETYGNRDFSSTTGATVKLEFRRPKEKPVRLDINYTLQFAEGTGSGTNSQRSLLASGQPNLRTVFPLSVDSRHMLNVNVDYRLTYREVGGKWVGLRGPKIGKWYPFANAGINLGFRTRSGEPYTRFSQAVSLSGGDFNSSPIVGTVNGSRLPWNYELNVRIDKDIIINPRGKIKRFVNVYTYINNLLNTKNTLGVYGYSGLPTDDSYLQSPQGVQALSNIQFRDAYTSQYTYAMFSSGNLNLPRRIFVGFLFDF